MGIQGIVIALTSNPTAIAGSLSTATPNISTHGTMRVLVRNRGAATVYLGDAAVTTNGYPLTTADVPDAIVLQPWDSLYGCSTGTISINVLRLNDVT